MIRLIGFFTGSAVAVAAILLVIGVPELQSHDAAVPPPEPVAARLPQPAPAEPQPVESHVETVVAAEPASSTNDEQETVSLPVVEDRLPNEVNIERKWHSFWSPFRSQIAANGFVSRLEAVTGFDYRVVKVDAGVYEVAFAYIDDDERTQKLSTIAAATGLDIPES